MSAHSLTVSESEARALRDAVFGTPISDKEWANYGANWMTADSIEWLREHAWPIRVIDQSGGFSVEGER